MREIRIDEDTRIYYIYEDKTYYIENKNTTTARTTATNAKHVLDIVAPSNTVTIDDLISLAETYETITSLSYTWEDTGAYIKTIQLNDFSTHPICIDCEKSKLYIMNTDVIFDLSINIDKKSRLTPIYSYFLHTLGLRIDTDIVNLPNLTIIYNTLMQYYTPTVYNVIGTRQVDDSGNPLPLRYTSNIKLSNYTNTSPVLYTVTPNPNSLYTPTPIANILQLESNIMTLTTPVPSSIHVGDTLTVTNAVTTVDTTTYTADGTYTIQSIHDNTIYTTENFNSPFLYVPSTVSAVAYKSSIESVSREDRTITFSTLADLSNFLIGDTITIYGTTIETEYETLTIDGNYTISDIKNHTITVEETPVTDYTVTEGQTPYAYKKILIGNIDTITDNTITIEENLLPSITTNSPVVIERIDDNSTIYTTLTNIEGVTLTISYTYTTPYTAQYGVLNQRVPYTETLVTIEESKNLAESILPVGKFMLDNFAQAVQYIQLVEELEYPTEDNLNSVLALVPSEYTLEESIGGIEKMQCLGVYSELYKE